MKARKIRFSVGTIGVFAAFLVMPLALAQSGKSTNDELAKVPRMSVEQLKSMLDKNTDVVVVDTRDSASYELGHIKGAINIYYDPLGDPMDREMTLVALPMDRQIVIYCACQNEEESAPMAVELYHLGYDHDKVQALRGGSIRWEEVGYPFIASGDAP